MKLLNKLYESNYFGIGLFAVISFLVVAFLIVLFFGKKDEQKRKMEGLNVKIDPSSDDTFKETTPMTTLEIPAQESMPQPVTPITPVAPMNYDIPVSPVQTPSVTPSPVGFDSTINNYGSVPPVMEPQVAPVTPISNINRVEPVNVMPTTPVTPVINEPTPIINNQPIEPIRPIIEEPVVPIMNEPIINRPVNPVISEPTYTNVAPINNDRIMVEPKVMEPIKITIPEEPQRVTPVIEPVMTPVAPTYNYSEPTPIIEEPVINETYYRPVEKVEPSGVNVPNIDFDAIAKSISQELDELENINNKNTINQNAEFRVTPTLEQTMRPASQFSSVYVANEPKPLALENMEMPKKIDLPTKKED